MCPLRRVEDQHAGSSALGILVPPGRRTFVIVRPRSLAWDLLLVRPETVGAFHELSREEAGGLADELYQALRHWSGTGSGHVEEVACPGGSGFWLRVRVGSFALVACGRRPGQPYEPLVFADADTALSAASQLRVILHPPASVEQEVYLNTLHFMR
jgi:hypothetical protein